MEKALHCSGQEKAEVNNSAPANNLHWPGHPFCFNQSPISRPSNRPIFRVGRLKAVIGFACIALTGTTQRVEGGTVLTFDELSPGTGYVPISNGYGGLIWSNFSCINGSLRPSSEDYHNGVVSTPNVAFNDYGNPASLRHTGP